MREDEYRQLAAERENMVVELRSFNDAVQERAAGNDGEVLAEDQAEFDKREADIIKLTNRLKIEQRSMYAANAAHDAIEKWAAVEKDPETFAEYRSGNPTNSRHVLPGGKVTQDEVDTPDVRQAVYSYLIRGREGMDVDEYRVLSKAASGGGFFVPTDLADEIIRALRFLPGGVASLARTIRTSGGETINLPLNLTHGVAAWLAESAADTPSDETITNMTLSAYKAGTKIIVSEELLTDTAFDLSSFLSTEFGERIGALAEDAYVNGDGTGKPTGILNGATVTRSTLPAGQVATTTYAGLAPSLLSVPAQYRYGPNVAILVSDTLFVRLLTIVDSTGRPIWAGGMSEGAPDRVLGMPVYTHPNLAAIGANSESGIVGDFSRGYAIRQVDGVFMQRQNELHSDNGQVGFRGYLRLDGKTTLADALRVIKFAAT
jgi:HK97 family phage major capsid protein